MTVSGESSEITRLREQVATLSAAVDALASLSEQEQDVTTAAIERLERTVAALLAPPVAAGQAPSVGGGEGASGEAEAAEPKAWVEYASADDWVALADWVDWLTGAYGLHEDRRPRPCWPAHGGVAEELAALHSAWREAAARAREGDGDALAFWHDRYLAPLMARLNHMYATASCTGRHAPDRPAPRTDRTLIDVRSAALRTTKSGSPGGSRVAVDEGTRRLQEVAAP